MSEPGVTRAHEAHDVGSSDEEAIYAILQGEDINE
jgi:hypothetical protein